LGRGFQLLAGVAALCVLALLAARPLAAWYADDTGNLALAKNQAQAAAGRFVYGLSLEPRWALLHEDLGRAVLDSDPAAALREFRIAACGSPCTAEEGDALLRLGRTNEAISSYIAAKAVARLGQRAQDLANSGRDGEAIALEQALISRLHDSFLERAELASAYATLGNLQIQAGWKKPAQAPALRRNAIGALQQAATLAPYNERYLLLYAFAQLQWGDRAAARTTFERILRLHPHQRDAEAALAELDASPPKP